MKDKELGKGTTRSLSIAERVLYFCELLTKSRFSQRYNGALSLIDLYMRQAVKKNNLSWTVIQPRELMRELTGNCHLQGHNP